MRKLAYYTRHIRIIIKRTRLLFMKVLPRSKGAGLDCVIHDIFEDAMPRCKKLSESEVRKFCFTKVLVNLKGKYLG